MAATDTESPKAEVPVCPFYLTEVTLYHDAAPISGRSLYFVVEETKFKTSLIHPWTFGHFTIPTEDFLRGQGATYWPPERRDAPPTEKVNMDKLAGTMLERLEDFAVQDRRHPSLLIRRIIAVIKSVPLGEVPIFKKNTEDGSEPGTGGKESKERGPRKPGIIDSIKSQLDRWSTIEQMVARLKEQFPDRDANGMKNTVKCQLTRLPGNTGREILKENRDNQVFFKWGKQK